MKKISLFFSLLLLCLFSLQAAPALPFLKTHPVPAFSLKSTKQVKASALFPVRVTNPQDGSVTTIYARLQYENEYTSGSGLYGDVVVRFYEDAGITPTSVTGLTVNYRVIGYNGSSPYDFTSNVSASGEYYVIAYNQEHDYDDGETFRYRDYHLEEGDYVSMP